MKKYGLLFALATVFLWGNASFIAPLQTTFFQEVNEATLYKKHYFHFLTSVCQENESCIYPTIQRLKSWKSVQENQFFQKAKQSYYQRVLLTDEELNSIQKYLFKIVASLPIQSSQFLSFLDLSQQRLSLFFYDSTTQTLHLIGSDLVSTGNMEKEKTITLGDDHYLKTPQGIFENLQGWRSKGEYNEDKQVMPYGKKGRFVFYFGRQKSIRYQIFNGDKSKIKNPQEAAIIHDYLQFALHAHESPLSLGEPHSHGCIRISNELNIFLDEFLILHANNIQNGRWKNPTAKKPQNFPKLPFTGKYLIIVDKI
jgi:hypothetical protein